jgi:hypothetical protein
MKILVFAITTLVLSVVMATGAVVFGQTATPTTVVSPSPTVTTTTTPTSTSTPSPTGQVQGATIPSGAPATGMGGN